jgi:hypothetical protein
MKILKTISLLLASFLFIKANAQNEIPKGYIKGSIVLQNNTTLNGYIKDNMKKDASVSFITDAAGKKTKYSGNDVSSVEIDGAKYTCIQGDFFRVICNGELCFLQKTSDAAGNITYNGSEAIYSSGAPGKPGDYFLYKNKELKLVSAQTFETVTNATFADYTPAIEKAKALKYNIGQLGEAVVIYNNRGGK